MLKKRYLNLFIAGLMGFCLSLLSVQMREYGLTGNIGVSSVNAQDFNNPIINVRSIRPEFVAQKVYESFEDIPKENQYINQETGEVDLDNTLISRMVRYHQYIKTRPTKFRLDWKLTLADYLGANENITEARYPGRSTLTINPMNGDLEAINKLNRRQRENLVNFLVSLYNPEASNSSKPKTAVETPEVQEEEATDEIRFPQPGGADLLKF